MLTYPFAIALGSLLDQRYRLDRPIGDGASSWVFAGRDLRLDRDVAIKVLKPRVAGEHAGHRKRFVSEGQFLAKLIHPHVVAIHDAGESADGLAYLVMELSCDDLCLTLAHHTPHNV